MCDSYIPVDTSSEITFFLMLEVHLAVLISFTDLDTQHSWGDLQGTDMISPAKCKGYLGKWIAIVSQW